MSCGFRRPVLVGSWQVSWADCGRPGAAVVTGACKHGHEREIQACAEHQALAAERDTIGCVTCFEAGHECPMTIRIRALPDPSNFIA